MNSFIAAVLAGLLGAGAEGLPPNHPPLSEGAGTSASSEMPVLPEGHPPAQGGKAPSAEELLSQLDEKKDLKDRPKPFEVAFAMGRLYYGGRRYAEAAEFLGQAKQKAQPLHEFWVAQQKKLSSKQIADASSSQCPPAETPLADAEVKIRAMKGAEAGACARRALAPALEAAELRGRAFFLLGKHKEALAELDWALKAEPNREGALYSRALVRMDGWGNDVPALKLAREDWKKLLVAHPSGPRAEESKKFLAHTEAAIAAGGLQGLAAKGEKERVAHPVALGGNSPGALPPVSPEAMEAISNTERTPELVQGLGKLVEEGEEHLAKGRYQDALDVYKRVVPFEPNNGRAKAGMAWALVGLGKSTADRVWGVAVGSDAEAVDKLGETLRAKGNVSGAKALWTKLAASAPEYAQKSKLADKIK
jgi:tetratricopeptide (TPR) repeat protein